MAENKTFEIAPVSKLRPLELVFPTHLKNLSKMILKDKVIKSPILADKKTGIVLDGSHRYVFFLEYGYKTAPVKFVDYDDENIRVGTVLMHKHIIKGDANISKKDVKERGMSGNLYPPRTTRHFFPFRKPDISVPLSQLEKGKKTDVTRYIMKATLQEEIDHNKKYIKEIEAEFDEVIRYLEEQRNVKKYLEKQISRMEKIKKGVAFFPGKFQPPHLGHVISLMQLYPKYDQIIIGITEDGPDVISQKERKAIFEKALEHLPKFKVVLIKGILTKMDSLKNLPKFDVCISGNEKVIEKIRGLGKETEFLPRSEGMYFSGTKIRKLLDLEK
ncbi:adenylyltransferase/cytidyltransferase family protein [Candidatus Woesearchaeota archaeon]|nr:adenylyltransferase/cytidyltransferase family protein [Candidatus Woesearchaeota archaeon]